MYDRPLLGRGKSEIVMHLLIPFPEQGFFFFNCHSLCNWTKLPCIIFAEDRDLDAVLQTWKGIHPSLHFLQQDEVSQNPEILENPLCPSKFCMPNLCSLIEKSGGFEDRNIVWNLDFRFQLCTYSSIIFIALFNLSQTVSHL